MAEAWKPKFSNLDLLDAIDRPRRRPIEEPYQERTDLDGGALKTLSSMYEGLKLPVSRALQKASLVADKVRTSGLAGLTVEPTNLLGINRGQKDIFIKPGSQLPQAYNRAISRVSGIPAENLEAVDTLVHEMVHSVPGADHGNQPLFDQTENTVRIDPDVRRTMEYYSKNIPPDYFTNWDTQVHLPYRGKLAARMR